MSQLSSQPLPNAELGRVQEAEVSETAKTHRFGTRDCKGLAMFPQLVPSLCLFILSGEEDNLAFKYPI